MAVPFDTLAYSRRLKAAGFSESQAEAQAEALAAAMTDTLATKADLEHQGGLFRSELRIAIEKLRTDIRGEIAALRVELRGEIEALRTALRGEIATLRGEVEGLRSELRQMESRVTTRLGGMMAAGFAILAILVKIL